MIDFDDIERFEENDFDEEEYQRVKLKHEQQMTQHQLKPQNNDTPPRSANNNQIDQKSSNYIAIALNLHNETWLCSLSKVYDSILM